MPHDHPGVSSPSSTPELGSRPRPDIPAQPMRHGVRPAVSEQIPASLVPEQGWHFLHLFYRVNRATLAKLTPEDRQRGLADFRRVLAANRSVLRSRSSASRCRGTRPILELSWRARTSGRFTTSRWPCRHPASGRRSSQPIRFTQLPKSQSMSPTPPNTHAFLRERESLDPDSDMFKAKVSSYAERLGPMNRHRLYPEFPNWPCLCFYPMSKIRGADQNWYMLSFESRSELMSQHARSGMKFSGRVSQVITASTGLDDWEWGVTLWARNPSFLKDIVYTMRFDESSAKYALFGDFYFGYILPLDELLETIRL